MKLALIGAGNRISFQYANNLEKNFKDTVEMVGVYDSNLTRANALSQRLEKAITVYDHVDDLLLKSGCDTVLIGTLDATHDFYIDKAMRLGLDVICEKPITTTPEKAKIILAAEKDSQKKLTITFNYRFTLFATTIKETLRAHSIGKIQSVHFEWLLDQAHGADYFRRWHREKKNSGGLAVHKATHHFDLINWLIEKKPLEVYAKGGLYFYGAKNSPFKGEHCRVCAHQKECKFYKDYSQDEAITSMFYNAEHEDGYHRDGCVFSDKIDIEDTITALVTYEDHIDLSYKLIAYAPYEGYRLTITGDHGRIEAEDFHGLIGPYANEQIYHLSVYDDQGNKKDIEVPISSGSHGGGDDRMMEMIFSNKVIPDPLNHMANSESGFNAAYIGMAINLSLKEKRVVSIEEMTQ
jgi:predicted dehydrogenase